MDIAAIGKVVAPFVPMVGSLLGGLIPFPGGSLIGQKVGEIIARQFGVDPASPTAAKDISDRIAEAGEETARAKINAAVEQARIQVDGFVAYERAILEAQVKNLADVNATMRAEIMVPPELREHWFFRAWRPAFAWGVLIVYVPFGLVLSYVAARASYLSSEPLKELNDAWPILVGYFGIGLAVVGVLIPSRSIEKKAAIQNAAPMPNAKPVPVPPPVAVNKGGLNASDQRLPPPPNPPASRLIPKPPGARD